MMDKKRAFKRISRWAVVPVVALGVGVTAVESGWGGPSADTKEVTPVTQAGVGVGGGPDQQETGVAPVKPDDGGQPDGAAQAKPPLERRDPARAGAHRHNHNGPLTIMNADLTIGPVNQQSPSALAAAYDRMINTMRDGAGPVYRQDVRATTTNRNRYLRLRVNRSGARPVDLYYTADDLYLRGYATHEDDRNPTLYELEGDRDGRPFRLGEALRWNPHDVVRTNIPVHYQALRNQGAPPIEAIRFGRTNLQNAVNTLNNTQPTQFRPGPGGPSDAPTTSQLASSLTHLMVTTAEAVRFRTLSAQIQGALRAENTTTLDDRNRVLINNWNGLSYYVIDVTNNTDTPPRRFAPPLSEIHNFAQARPMIAVVHSRQ